MAKLVNGLIMVMLSSITMPSFAMAAPVDTQQQIIAQKEQEQASKRAEQELQHRVSQGMTKSQLQGRRLEAFVF